MACSLACASGVAGLGSMRRFGLKVVRATMSEDIAPARQSVSTEDSTVGQTVTSIARAQRCSAVVMRCAGLHIEGHRQPLGIS